MRRDFTPAEAEAKFEEMYEAGHDDQQIGRWILLAARSEGVEITDTTAAHEIGYAATKLLSKGIDLAAVIRRHH